MARISLLASGSRGDVQPYVALGLGLAAAGHDVRLLANEDYAPVAGEAGLAFGSLGASLHDHIHTDEWRQAIEGGNPLSLFRKMQTEMAGVAGPLADRLLDFLPDTDAIIAGFAGLGLTAAAKAHGVPLIFAFVVPFTPTAAFPSPLTPNVPAFGPLNRASFHVARQMLWQTSKAPDRILRERLELPRGPFLGPFATLDQPGVPVLYGYSPHVLPRPADWGSTIYVTGYWFLDEAHGWTPPDDLLAFLDAGAPPVYMGFGSMGSRDPQETGRIALDALAQVGQRGILAAGWGGLRVDDVPETVHLIDSMPHSWLFPQMAAIVHHGGVGTTAAGLRAGVPSVVVPFMADQPFWGRRVAELGVGPEPIPRKKLTADKLAAAIRQAVSDEAMRQKAAALGKAIRAENGVGEAVALTEQVLLR